MLPASLRTILQLGDGNQSPQEARLLVRLELVQFLSYMAVTATALYVAVLGKELGLSNVEIGTLVTGYALALLVSTYVFGTLSDVYGTRPFLIGGFLFSGLMLLIHVLVFNYQSFLFTRLITGVALGIYPGALFSLASKMNAKMGRFSAFGALGGFVGLVTAGAVTGTFGTRALFVLCALAVFVAFALSIPLKDRGQVVDRASISPMRTFKENLGIYVTLLVRHSGANLAWTFWPLYLLVLGANYFYVGVISASNSLAQFLASFYLADRFDGRKEFDIGLMLSGLTLVGLGLATNLAQAWLLYVLIGGIWGFVYVGGLRTVLDRSNQKGATVAAYNSVVNLSTLLGPMMATVLIEFADYRATMYVAAALAFASYVISKKLKT